MRTSSESVKTDIVLIGGGHAHVHVVRAFGMRPEPGVRVTLVARDLETPYSGMLPGLIAGHYTFDECHIDLPRLCRAMGTRLIHAPAVGLDRGGKRALLEGRPSIAYDVVSLDVGVTPLLSAVEGAAEHGIAVKPIGAFLEKWERLRRRMREPDGPRRLAMVGGGAAGCELALAIRHVLNKDAESAGFDPKAFVVTLASGGELLEGYNDRFRAAAKRALDAAGISYFENRRATHLDSQALTLDDGSRIEAQAALFSTDAAAPDWLRGTGLAVDEKGFVSVHPTLRSVTDAAVFAAGDCADMVESPRPKAGVFAVRQGVVLARNLRRLARGERLEDYKPQRRYLTLLTTGGRNALASRGMFYARGAWVWRWKDFIDRRWMRMYQIRGE